MILVQTLLPDDVDTLLCQMHPRPDSFPVLMLSLAPEPGLTPEIPGIPQTRIIDAVNNFDVTEVSIGFYENSELNIFPSHIKYSKGLIRINRALAEGLRESRKLFVTLDKFGRQALHLEAKSILEA